MKPQQKYLSPKTDRIGGERVGVLVLVCGRSWVGAQIGSNQRL